MVTWAWATGTVPTSTVVTVATLTDDTRFKWATDTVAAWAIVVRVVVGCCIVIVPFHGSTQQHGPLQSLQNNFLFP